MEPRHTDRETDTQTDRSIDRYIDKDRETGRQADRQTDRQILDVLRLVNREKGHIRAKQTAFLPTSEHSDSLFH